MVNDGSADNTGQVVEALARRHYPRVRLLNHKQNQGYGAAIRTGFGHAQYGLVFFTDNFFFFPPPPPPAIVAPKD